MARPALNVLVLSDFKGSDANVIPDFLYSFNKHSRHRFFYMHRWGGNDFRRLANFDFNQFDAIVLFWNYYWIGSVDHLSHAYVPSWLAERIADSKALKIQFLQDEYRDIHLANQAMSRFGVNLMFSCVAKKDQELFYPKAAIPSLLATYPVLTGYVPRYLENVHYPASIDRPIDIGYRSRQVPYYLGNLGQEKSIIADQFQQIALQYDFSANISAREDDRIYGKRWLTFMKLCRFSLGTESGASVVDFDGSIKKNCEAYLREHPNASYEEVSNLFFAHLDGKVEVRTISPRIFEASAFENTLILHEGYYEGILEPDVHYISVKKDYSNVQEVVERMKDRGFSEQLARSARERLIDSGEFNYDSFARYFDGVLDQHVPSPIRKKNGSRTLFYCANYIHGDFAIPVGTASFRLPLFSIPVGATSFRLPLAADAISNRVYSLWLIIGLFARSNSLRKKLLWAISHQLTRNPMSLFGLIKDLRILALIPLSRDRVKMHHTPDFRLRLSCLENTDFITIKSVPVADGGKTEGNDSESAQQEADRTTLGRALKKHAKLNLIWEHRLIGTSMLLPLKNSICRIFLNKEGKWYFFSFNQLTYETPEDYHAILAELLYAELKAPTFLEKANAIVQLGWILVRTFLIVKSIECVQRCLKRAANVLAFFQVKKEEKKTTTTSG